MKFKLNIKKGLGILVLVISIANISSAQQDPMYTQYFFATQTINPAYAGTWESLGFTALARRQWVGWNNAPSTFTFSMQAPLRNEKVALGLNVISDNVGKEKRFGLYGDYSYRVKMSENTFLRMGLKGGFSNYSNNLPAYELVDPNDPLFQDEIKNKFIPNFGVGLYLYNRIFFLGLSVPKLLHSDIEMSNEENFSVQAEMRHYFAEAGVVLNLGENLKFKPTVLSKVMAGVPLQLDFTGNFLISEKLWLGATYRTHSAYGFIAQWIFGQKLRIGYAVDFSTTNLQNYHDGSHEIMVSYQLGTIKGMAEALPRYF